MANADFSQKQQNPGGFDAGSYREQKKPEETVRLTPAQQKLAALEAKLPGALRTQAAALALSVVVMLAAFFGFGGAKLRTKYNEARQWFTVGVAADNGYNLNEELNTRGKRYYHRQQHPWHRQCRSAGGTGRPDGVQRCAGRCERGQHPDARTVSGQRNAGCCH